MLDIKPEQRILHLRNPEPSPGEGSVILVPVLLHVAHSKSSAAIDASDKGATLALLLLLLVFDKLSYGLRVGAVPLAAERAP